MKNLKIIMKFLIDEETKEGAAMLELVSKKTNKEFKSEIGSVGITPLTYNYQVSDKED